MNTASPSAFPGSLNNPAIGSRIFLAVLLMMGAGVSAPGQGQMAGGTVSGSGSGPYTYSLTFSNSAAATAPVGSIWYAWVPGSFFLPGVPTSSLAPVGWAATIVSDSIQFTADAPADYLTAGEVLTGFSYQASFTP